MKILKEGNKWWVGKEVDCPTCDAKFVIEKADTVFAAKDHFRVYCPACDNPAIVHRWHCTSGTAGVPTERIAPPW